MRFEEWQHSFLLDGDDPLELAERILGRPARLTQTWTDDYGREVRVYVPDEDGTLMLTDEIITRRDGGRWRRVRFVDRPDLRR